MNVEQVGGKRDWQSARIRRGRKVIELNPPHFAVLVYIDYPDEEEDAN